MPQYLDPTKYMTVVLPVPSSVEDTQKLYAEMAVKGYRVVAGEPVGEIEFVQTGYKYTFEKIGEN